MSIELNCYSRVTFICDYVKELSFLVYDMEWTADVDCAMGFTNNT